MNNKAKEDNKTGGGVDTIGGNSLVKWFFTF